jgi:hypothetical protein
MIDCLEWFKKEKSKYSSMLKMRIGIHTGKIIGLTN